MKNLSLVTALAAITLLRGAASSGAAPDRGIEMDATRPKWSRLEYRAKKLTLKIDSSVELHRVTEAKLAKELIEPGVGSPVGAEGDAAYLLSIDSRGLGRESMVEFWFRPDAAALQRRQIETAPKTRHNRFKINRFTRQGVYSLIRRPTDDQVGGPHEKWTESYQDHRSFPEAALDLGPVSEPSALFYVVSAARLSSAGDRFELPVLSKGRVVLVSLSVQGRDRTRVRYSEESRQGTREIVGERETVVIALESRPLETGGDEDDFRFLGLGGEILLYVDAAHRVPVKISGRIRYAGKGHIKLRRLVLR